ncbi:uncharacterized protein LOC119726895 [Patiria miniata]|uniref:Uncharacterized protein n=1 Tax=Patiria miniata TaxID=46514 RepID=A0A913ZSC9_PATMI|nr:uncharacterized protein LOC119726895 [Patiria miniata]
MATGSGQQPVPITVVTETRNLKSQPFTHPDDQISTGNAWEEWLEGIEREFRYFKISSPIDKKDALIIYGGKEIARLEKSLPNPGDVDDVYEKLKTKLNSYYTPKKNKHHARYLFLKMRPTPQETTMAYAARLREKAIQCEFGDTRDDRILEHLIQTITSKSLIQKAINKKWSLTQMLTEAAQIEDTSLQISSMRPPDDGASNVAKVGYQQSSRQKKSTGGHYGKPKFHKSPPCAYCGLTGTHPQGKNCPAYGKKCNKCQKWNHFASVCRADRLRAESRGPPSQPVPPKYAKPKQRGNHVKKTSMEEDDQTSSDDEFFDQAVKHLKQVRRIAKTVHDDSTVTVRIDDVDVRIEPDSGAEVNIMDEHQHKALQHRSSNPQSLQASHIKLHTLQSDLPVKGEFRTIVRNDTRGAATKFVVVKGRINSPPLISKNTLIELGMMKLQPDGSLAEINDLRIPENTQTVKSISNTTTARQQTQKIVEKYKRVFQGIGLIRDVKSDTDIFAKFNMKPEAAPVAQKPRPVAYYLQKPLKEWLDQCIKEGIFEEVPPGEPVTWCSPLVV